MQLWSPTAEKANSLGIFNRFLLLLGATWLLFLSRTLCLSEILLELWLRHYSSKLTKSSNYSLEAPSSISVLIQRVRLSPHHHASGRNGRRSPSKTGKYLKRLKFSSWNYNPTFFPRQNSNSGYKLDLKLSVTQINFTQLRVRSSTMAYSFHTDPEP